MKRSQKEYDEILGFIKSELINTSNPWNKPPTKELEARFNDWATNNNIKPVGLRTIQNYLNVLKDDKELNLYNHNNSLNQNRQDSNKFYSTKSLNPNAYEIERIELAQKILEPWLRVLPRSITKELVQPVKGKDKLDYPAVTVAHPRYQPKKGFNDMVLEFMSMIHGGKLCRFMYKPGHSDLDDNMEQTPEGFSWLKVVYCMPLQLNIYLDRVYLLAYSLSKDELLNGQYEVHSSNQDDSPLKYAKISRFVLANINDYQVDALENYVQENAELGPLMDPIRKFQIQFKPSYILEAFSITKIQEDIIGVVLPDEEQLRKEADTMPENGMEKKVSSPFSPFAPYSPPKPILRYFSGWAMRYILNSPLHPSQLLKKTQVIKGSLNTQGNEQNLQNPSIEIGLFEFTVWNTVDFKFRIASFRESSWGEEYGFEGPNPSQIYSDVIDSVSTASKIREA